MKKMFCCCMILCALTGSAALPSKLNILLVDVGTIDTVAKTEKFMAAVDKACLEAPPVPKAADAALDPDLQKEAVRINWLTGVAEYVRQRDEVHAENARRRKMLEGLRNSIVANKDNRMIVIAKDYLASGLEEYSDFIAIVDRSDASLSEVEKAIADKDQEEVAPATLFLSVTMGDLQRVSKVIPLGGATVKKDSYTRKATAKVSDFNNVRVFSCDVTAKYDTRKTDAVATSGDESVIADALIEDAMKQIAKRVGEKFVKEYVVNVTIPKALSEEVTPEEIELYLDRDVKVVDGEESVIYEGVPIQVGEPFKALSLNHTVSAISSNEDITLSPAKTILSSSKLKAVIRVKAKK